MFEDKTKEAVQLRVLGRLADNNDVSPHSPLYIVTAPVAEGWAEFYKDLDKGLKQVFPSTADREYIVKDAEKYGIAPYPASYAQVEGEFNIEVEIGDRFSKGQVNFSVTEFLRSEHLEEEDENHRYYYSLTCEQAGEIGNVAPGKIIPIQAINGLKVSNITRILVPGEEEENTETFRQRYLSSFNNKAFCANLADYFQELGAYSGIGKFKVLRCINNEGISDPEWVTIVFTDSEFKRPSEELVGNVQEYFQPLDDKTHLPSIETSGLGLSAIGQLCWVEGVNEEEVNIKLNLSFEQEYSWENTQEQIKKVIEDYLTELVEKEWGDTIVTAKSYKPMEYHLTLKRAEIESRILDIEGVFDSNAVIINEKSQNYDLTWNTIPKLGTLEATDQTGSGSGSCPYDCPDCQCNQDGSICPRCQGE